MSDSDLSKQLAELVGQPISDAGPTIAPDPVNQPMIRHWAAALEDGNPIYTDTAAATASRWGEIVAPPMMLQTWTMATPAITGIRERGGSPVATTRNPLTPLDEAGFVGTLATNSEVEVERYLHLGESITATTVLDSVSDEKQTRLGRGIFVTWVTTWHDATGERVGRQTFRILKFRPDAGSPP